MDEEADRNIHYSHCYYVSTDVRNKGITLSKHSSAGLTALRAICCGTGRKVRMSICTGQSEQVLAQESQNEYLHRKVRTSTCTGKSKRVLAQESQNEYLHRKVRTSTCTGQSEGVPRSAKSEISTCRMKSETGTKSETSKGCHSKNVTESLNLCPPLGAGVP